MEENLHTHDLGGPAPTWAEWPTHSDVTGGPTPTRPDVVDPTAKSPGERGYASTTPAVGSVVRYVDHDPYDNVDKVRYGLVIDHVESGDHADLLVTWLELGAQLNPAVCKPTGS